MNIGLFETSSESATATTHARLWLDKHSFMPILSRLRYFMRRRARGIDSTCALSPTFAHSPARGQVCIPPQFELGFIQADWTVHNLSSLSNLTRQYLRVAEGMLIVGGIGSGKTSACMHPYMEQLLGDRADDPSRKAAGLVLEVKGDFCRQVQDILRRHGRADDYVEVSLESERF
jgi:hypothetical protein